MMKIIETGTVKKFLYFLYPECDHDVSQNLISFVFGQVCTHKKFHKDAFVSFRVITKTHRNRTSLVEVIIEAFTKH